MSCSFQHLVNTICFLFSISCSVSVDVEARLWLPVLLESALRRQLQGHDPGSTPVPGQNEKPCHQAVEAADRRPHHSELPWSLSSLSVPKLLNLMRVCPTDDLHALEKGFVIQHQGMNAVFDVTRLPRSNFIGTRSGYLHYMFRFHLMSIERKKKCHFSFQTEENEV